MSELSATFLCQGGKGEGDVSFTAIVWVDKRVGPWTWIRDGQQGLPWPEPKQPALLANWFDEGWKIVGAQQIGSDPAGDDLVLLLRHDGAPP
jgi:hypothetical protein